MKEILLNNGLITIIDDSDYEWAIKFKWYCDIVVLKNGDKYYKIGNRNGLLHRQILNVTDPKVQVDHINHNRLDNRRENLRLCTPQQNILNTRKKVNTTSKFKGVCKPKNAKKWAASCSGKHIGYFNTELEAALAYDNFVKTLPNQEFRVLNFPDKSSSL